VLEQFLSLYIHIPFCSVRCTYCAFYVVTNAEARIPAYVAALCNELTWLGKSTRQPIHTIYFGGGTPSLLTPSQVSEILATCRRVFDVRADAEISMEANPTLLTEDYLEQVRASGVNRLSIGMQSAQPGELRLMRRDHAVESVPHTLSQARKAGFNNVNLDLIFGLPDQSLDQWTESVEAALSLSPDHLSMYALELEENTAMTINIERGKLHSPDEDLTAQMYETADALASEAGFGQYEISNWAKPGHECRHNLQYWTYGDYLGVGAGAHGFASGLRYQVVRSLRQYIERARLQEAPLPFPFTAAVDHHEIIDQRAAMSEYLFTGLRKVQEGVTLSDFERRFGIPLVTAFGPAIERLTMQGLLTRVGDHLRLTPAARLISNRVSLEFMGE